ncbi:cupin domain-containing protein [Paraburkholderia diazotrophica]|uniref:cupin domain-containing protein n=1 Tax=Paraburkholderia diazotrophica TaxID=667676 RepID=UPI00318281BB
MFESPRELLKAAHIDALEPQRSVHPLNDRAIRLKRPLSELTGLTQFGFHLVTIQPGCESTEYHRHLYEEECIYVLSGTGEAIIDERAYEIGAGDVMGFARGGAAHTVFNTGHIPLELIVAGQRLEHDVCDYPQQGKCQYVAGATSVLVDLPKQAMNPGSERTT